MRMIATRRDGRYLALVALGAFFFAVGALEAPYVFNACGTPPPPGAMCTPTGFGVSSVALLGLGALITVVGGYYFVTKPKAVTL